MNSLRMNNSNYLTLYLLSACSFSIDGLIKPNLKFILRPVSAPFRLDFELKALKGALIALAGNETRSTIFAKLSECFS